MNEAPTVSVVVVSHQRPEALTLCLTALSQLDFDPLEVVVAADRGGLDALARAGFADTVKQVLVEAPGISAARNAGIAQAAGEIVAFIDDDAVAEPTWLTHLTAPFADPQVAATGGFTRGRNGISFQWRGRSVDALGHHRALEIAGDAPVRPDPGPGRALRTEGTNMAIRRRVLARLGGFDPAYRFYLDETDLNMRLARGGFVTCLVPLAQVHHGVAPSRWRAENRAPRSLFDIGASSAVYWRKFADPADVGAAAAQLRREQRDRLLRHMVAGRLEPRDLRRLMADLEDGMAEGQARPLTDLAPLPASGATPFKPFPAMPDAPHRLICGRIWQQNRLSAAARAARGAGPVTLFLFSPTARPHRMRFRPDGIWEQRGGLFGRSDRHGPHLRLHRFCTRVARERARLAPVRPMLHCGTCATPEGRSLQDEKE